MKSEYSEPDMQPLELLIYLGVPRCSMGYKCLVQCFWAVTDGKAPGVEAYEKAAEDLGCTVAYIVVQGQRALCRAQQRQPLKWEELFPALNVERAGLTLFLRHATAWLRHNRIAVCRLGHEKYRVPVPKT